jgi:hypothetical protein
LALIILVLLHINNFGAKNSSCMWIGEIRNRLTL